MRPRNLLLALSLLLPATLTAQTSAGGGGPVPIKRGVNVPPKLKKVGTWYFPATKPNGEAQAVVQAVVDTTGHVIPSTIKIISISDSAFITAAKATLETATFKPGIMDKQRVEVMIQVPLTFNSSSAPRCPVGNLEPDGRRHCM